MSMPPLWLVTGERGVGKSSFCRSLAAWARQQGWDAAGLTSPAVYTDGQRSGILAEVVRTGEAHLLASTRAHSSEDLSLGRWYFNRAVLAWGDQVINGSPPCDLLILDEIGPLELTHQDGWQSALLVLRGRKYKAGLVVVRPELQQQVHQLLPITTTLIIDKTRPADTWVQSCWPLLSAESQPRRR